MEITAVTKSDMDAWLSTATPYEALSLAIKLEQGAVRQYSSMAAASRNPLTCAKLRYLAQEEREHARLLSRARRGLPRPRKPSALPDVAAEVSDKPAKDTPKDWLQVAIEAEKEAEQLYRRCAQRCRRGPAQKMFEHLADQESRHARMLSDELRELLGEFAWRSLEGAMPSEEDFWA